MSDLSDEVWDRVKMTCAYEVTKQQLQMIVLGTLYTLESFPPTNLPLAIEALEKDLGMT